MSVFEKGNAVIGQSGGPTAAINATLSGVIRGVMAQQGEGGCIDRLWGMCNGMEGLSERRLICLSDFFDCDEKLKILEQTPAAVLGSCRKKLPDPDSDRAEDQATYAKIFEILEEKQILYFFYIGGNDSMDTVLKLSRYAEKYNKKVRIIGIPKTIDNDLPVTDHAPGYGSAAKFIATVTQEIIRDCAVYTTKAVTIIECMGRDAGWLTAATALGRVTGGETPDLVYCAECPFDMVRFFTTLEQKFQEKSALVVAISEGLRFADGRYVGEGCQNGAADIFGHLYLSGTGKALEMAVKERFGCKVRTVELNLLQRCAGHCLSLTDISESIQIGNAAVQAAMAGNSGVAMIFKRIPGAEYGCRIECADVSKIANQTRLLPPEFINETNDNVTDRCCEYILPLIGGQCDILYNCGIPQHLTLPK